MSLFKKILGMVLATTMLITSATMNITAQEFNLPPEIKLEKDNFDTLDAVIEKYTTVYTQQVNSKEDRIQSVAVAENVGAVSGETIIKLDSDLARVAHFFYRLDLYGTDMADLQVSVKTPAGTKSLSVPWRNEKIIQGRARESFLLQEGNTDVGFYDGWEIIITGTGNIDKIIFFEQNGLPITYDVTAYGVLGGDKPILDVSVDVDATARLDIEGITEFENRKFKNLYAAPIGADEGFVVAEYFTNKDFAPGRQIMKFYDGLEHAHWAGNGAPVMTEDPNRAGYGDYTHFDEHFTRNEAEIKLFDTYYPSDMSFTTCYNHWPSWNWDDSKRGLAGNNSNGTPGVAYFTQAADLAAQYTLAVQEKHGGRSPKWIEVKNESTITTNWNHHNDATVDSWQLLADFHNLVSQEIKKVSPETLVGGPTAAWMALDASDFAEGRRNLKFMDDTKGNMDFYSYHFYENIDLLVNDTETNNTGYLSGRFEADLDLLRNHMVLTDNVVPFMVSETGTLYSGPTDPDFFILLKNFNSYMIRYMNRPNEFDHVTSFLLPIIWWDKDDPNMLMAYNDAQNAPGELTKMHYFIEAWSEYNGKLAPIHADNDKLFTHAALDGNVMYVALNNLNPQRVSVDLNLDTGDAEIVSIERNRTYLDMGELFYDEDEVASLENLPMNAEETSILKITLDKVPNVEETSYKHTYYGDKTLQPTGSAASFKIAAPAAYATKSVLRVSFGRDSGFTEDMSVTFNGEQYTADLEYTNKSDRYFGYLDFEVPTDILKDSNDVVVNIPQEGGMVSTVTLINHYEKPYEEEIVATFANSNMLIDGVNHTFEAYQVDGTTYFEIEDLATALNGSAKQFDMKWDEDKESFDLIANSPFSRVALEPEKSGGNLRYANVTDSVIYVAGENAGMSGIEVQNSDYFKLRDVCRAMDIEVGWDEASNTISLNTTNGYSE